MSDETKATGQWVVLEAMGHRRVAGRMSEVTIAGVQLVQVEVFCGADHLVAVQRYAGQALYCITDTTEAEAKKSATYLCGHADHAKMLPPADDPGDDDGVIDEFNLNAPGGVTEGESGAGRA